MKQCSNPLIKGIKASPLLAYTKPAYTVVTLELKDIITPQLHYNYIWKNLKEFSTECYLSR